MTKEIADIRLAKIKHSLSRICHESGILTGQNIDDFYHDHLIESGIIDSMGVACLQDQIESHYKITISLEQFVAELHTLAKLTNYLANDTTVEIPA